MVGTGPDGIVDTLRVERLPVRTRPSGRRSGSSGGRSKPGTRWTRSGSARSDRLSSRAGNPRYGWITSTPKLDWANVDMVSPFRQALGLPVGLDTDVNAAALAEGRWGAAKGLGSFVYLTLGTGIGGGAVIDGRPVHGLGHPEMGHLAVPRRPGDRFEGVCPFHGDCWEGLASGPAVAARFGERAEALEGSRRVQAAQLVGFYLAAGVRSIIYALSPQRVVVGGGLSMLPGIVTAARHELAGQLNGYAGLPEHREGDFIVLARLGMMAGPAGTLLLAEQACQAASMRASGRRRTTAVQI